MEQVYLSSRGRRIGKKTRAKIRAACPCHAHLLSGEFKGYYYQLAPNGVVFVMCPPELVITVFQLGKDK